MKNKLKHLDLFSGILGFSLGLQSTKKYRTVGLCDNEKHCQNVAKKHLPKIPIWQDIKRLNDYFEKASISLRGDSLVRTSPLQEKKLEYSTTNPPPKPETDRDYGGRCVEPFAWYDHESRLWRTWQLCLIEGWGRFSETWPRSGMTRNGIAYRLQTLAHPISETECSLLPTPQASDNRNRGNVSNQFSKRRERIGKQIGLSMLFKGDPCPSCVEGMMGLPKHWTKTGDHKESVMTGLGNSVDPQIVKQLGEQIWQDIKNR